MKAKEKWRCAACAELHEDEIDAQDCCPPESVWVCIRCEEGHEKEAEAEKCCLGLTEGATGVLCLCGAHLWAEDERPSMIIGDQVRCPRCRAKVLAGVSSGEAIRQSFAERGLAIR